MNAQQEQSTGGRLAGSRVALLAHGFEASELYRPLAALREAGAEVSIISISKSADEIRGWEGATGVTHWRSTEPWMIMGPKNSTR